MIQKVKIIVPSYTSYFEQQKLGLETNFKIEFEFEFWKLLLGVPTGQIFDGHYSILLLHTSNRRLERQDSTGAFEMIQNIVWNVVAYKKGGRIRSIVDEGSNITRWPLYTLRSCCICTCIDKTDHSYIHSWRTCEMEASSLW
jgi:hypothetical protein